MLKGSLPEKVDHRKLAREGASLTGTMALGRFARLAETLLHRRGNVEVTLEFARGKGQNTRIVGDASAEVAVTCQYCLEEMTLPLSATFDVLVVSSTEALVALPQGQDGLVCESEDLLLTDVVEDELIVSLPMVPRHESGDCADLSGYSDDDVEEGDTHRPFASLKQKMKKHSR